MGVALVRMVLHLCESHLFFICINTCSNLPNLEPRNFENALLFYVPAVSEDFQSTGKGDRQLRVGGSNASWSDIMQFRSCMPSILTIILKITSSYSPTLHSSNASDLAGLKIYTSDT